MAFPQTAAPTETIFNTGATTHNVTMPATVDSGDLLVALIGMTSNGDNNTDPVIATPSGWTRLDYDTDFIGSSSDGAGGVYVKIADGTEDGGTVNWSTTATTRGVAQVYRVTAWNGTSSGWSIAELSGFATTTPDPPSLTPSFGASDTLWMVMGFWLQDNELISAASANYTDAVDTITAFSGSNDMTIGSFRRELNAASEDPGTFTLDASAHGTVWTVGIQSTTGTITGVGRKHQGFIYARPYL